MLASGSTALHVLHSSHQEKVSDSTELLAGIVAGDGAAWSAVVERYGRLLRHVCRRLQLTPEQTEDVVQTTWIALFTHADSIQNADGLVGWLVTTTRREGVAVRRRESHEIVTDDCGHDAPDLDIDIDLEVGAQLDAGPRRRVLRQAIATLPARERALVEILLEPDLPAYVEISRRLQMPMGAIGPVRQRALRRLRRLLVEIGSEIGLEASA